MLVHLVLFHFLEDIDFAASSPIRLLFVSFEMDNWDPHSHSGCHLLKCMLQTLPDNKIVEDVHNKIRQDARGNKNCKQKLPGIQDLVLRSGVLEARDIKHPAAVSRNVFLQSFKETKAKHDRHKFLACKHKLPPRISQIMGRRFWKSNTEAGTHTVYAAWAWLQHYMENDLGLNGTSLKAASFSNLLCLFAFCWITEMVRIRLHWDLHVGL